LLTLGPGQLWTPAGLGVRVADLARLERLHLRPHLEFRGVV